MCFWDTTTRLCSTCFVLPPSLDWCTQLAHGVVTPRHRIASASTRSSIAPVVMAAARRACWPSTTSVMLLTMNFSLKLPDCQTTSCMHYYHHHQPHHNVMTSDSASTHCSCLNTLHTYRTVTFSCACYIKNKYYRPTQFQPYTSLRHIAFTNTILCTFVFRLLFFMCGLHSVMP